MSNENSTAPTAVAIAREAAPIIKPPITNENWPPERLTDHSAHSKYFPPDEEAYQTLKDSVRASGAVTEALQILPDGVVLCGRDRRRAARDLDLIAVPVVVRHDLVGDESGQLKLLIENNLVRKQFSQARRVRLVLALEELGALGGKLATGQKRRDAMAARVGDMCGRTFDKAERVLNSGAPIAKLYVDDMITADLAGRALDLPTAVQFDLVRRVETVPHDERRSFASKLLNEKLERSKPPAASAKQTQTTPPKAPTKAEESKRPEPAKPTPPPPVTPLAAPNSTVAPARAKAPTAREPRPRLEVADTLPPLDAASRNSLSENIVLGAKTLAEAFRYFSRLEEDDQVQLVERLMAHRASFQAEVEGALGLMDDLVELMAVVKAA